MCYNVGEGRKVRRTIILFIVFSTLLIPFDVFAACDTQRMADLMKIASNVQINSSYEINENNYPNFTVELSNITPDIYVVDSYNNVFRHDSEKSVHYFDGVSVTYFIYSADANCYGRKLNTKYVNLSSYNRFFAYDECKDNPDFKYCKLWLKTGGVTDLEFSNALSKYKNSSVSEEAVNTESGYNYFFYLVIGFIFVLVIVLVVRRRRE